MPNENTWIVRRRLIRRQLHVRRTALVLLLSIASLFLTYSLFSPFGKPNTHVVLLPAASPEALQEPGLGLAAFLPYVSRLRQNSVLHLPSEFEGVVRSPNGFRQLGDRLARLNIHDSDTLVLCVTAHGISINAQPFLLCQDFDANDLHGLFPVEELLHHVLQSCPSKTNKLLVLDAGCLSYEPQLGIVANDFPSLLKDAVRRVRDPDRSLWILCSHSNFQQSEESSALNGSVFATFVAAGLGGAADNNLDGFVDLRELEDFVSSWVNQWARDTMSSEQMPMLLWTGGDDPLRDNPRLISTYGTREWDVSELILGIQAPGQRVAVSGRQPGRVPVGPLDATAVQERGGVILTEELEQTGATNGQVAESHDKPVSGSATASADANATPISDARLRASALLLQAWRVRDALRAQSRVENSPVDYVPHVWRSFETELLNYQRRFRTSHEDSLVAIPSLLQSSLSSITEHSSRQTDSNYPLPRRRNTREVLGQLSVLAEPRTVAFANLIGADEGAALSDALNAVDALRVSDPEQLVQWLNDNWQPLYDDYYELRLLRQLIQADVTDASLLRIAFKTRRDGERAAAIDLSCANWIDEQIEEADQLRLAGERQLLDQIGGEWQHLARQYLSTAIVRYGEAIKSHGKIQKAKHLRNKLYSLAPYYVHSHQLLPSGKVDNFLNLLSKLADLLDSPSPKTISDIGKLTGILEAEQAAIQKSLRGEINRDHPTPVDALRIERLMSTPILSSMERADLTELAREFNESLGRRVRLSTPPNHEDKTSTMQEIVQRCRLETAVALLACPVAKNDVAYQRLIRTRDHLIKEPNLASYRGFAAALRQFYNALPARVHEWSTPSAYARPIDTSRMVHARRALLMLTGTRAMQFKDIQMADLSAAHDFDNLLRWHAKRFLSARSDQDNVEQRYLVASADNYQRHAEKIGVRESIATPEIRIRTTPMPLVLTSREYVVMEILVSTTVASRNPAWIILEYDQDAIQVQTPPNVYHQHRLHQDIEQVLVQNAGPSASDLKRFSGTVNSTTQIQTSHPSRPDLIGLPPTISSVSGQTKSFVIQVRRAARVAQEAKLIVKCISAPLSADRTSSITRSDKRLVYFRREVRVISPLFRLAIDGPAARSDAADSAFVLHPFPNQGTQFRIGVINNAAVDRNVNIQVFAPSQPWNLAAHSLQETREYLNSLNSILKIENLSSAPNGRLSFAHASEENQAATPEEQAKSHLPPEQNARPIEHGLLVEIEDAADPDLRVVESVSIRPQRPRRYVVPRVSYDVLNERIEVTVAARGNTRFPKHGVNIRASLVEAPRDGLQGRLSARLQSSEETATLFINVPSRPPQTVTLYLDVDEYPRAFIYRVPCDRQAFDIPELKDIVDLRISTPASGSVIAPAMDLDVQLLIDAPVGSFDAGRDVITIGIDQDADGALDAGSMTRLNSDRAVDVYATNPKDRGIIALHASVNDHSLSLPAKGLQNAEVQVFGHALIGGRQYPIKPIKFRVDGTGPVIIVDQLNIVVTTESEVYVTGTTRDAMSTVDLIQASFDADNTGEFPEEGDFAEVRPREDFSWRLRIKAGKEAGLQALLIRAIDHVGRKSSTVAIAVTVITPEEDAALNEKQTAQVVGRVTYRQEPAVDADLRLLDENGNQVAQAITDKRGLFLFDRVKKGKYTVKTRHVVLNVPRTSDNAISVDPGKQPQLEFNVELE